MTATARRIDPLLLAVGLGAAACALTLAAAVAPLACRRADDAAVALFVVKLLVLAPIVEEVFARGVVQRFLLARWPGRRVGVISLANAGAALVFSALHLAYAPPALAAWVLLPALLIGALYERTGRIAVCVLAHAGLNAGWILLSLGVCR